MSLGHGAGIVRSGLLLHLDAANPRSEPGDGNVVYDLSINQNHTTKMNSVGYDSTNKGSWAFDGSTSYFDCGPVTQINSSLTGLTVSVWVYPTVRGVKCIAENGTDYTTNSFYMFQENVNYFTFEVYGTLYDVVYSNYVYQLNTWYNLVGTWASGAAVNLYTNGVLTSGGRGGVTQTSLRNGNSNLHIASRPSNSTYRFQGNMSSVMFYNRALSQPEIQQNFNALRGRYGI